MRGLNAGFAAQTGVWLWGWNGAVPAPKLFLSKQFVNLNCICPASSKVTAVTTAQRRARGDMKGSVSIQDTMASDTEPSNTIKLLHLLFLSTSWGMQVWVTFVAGFVMSRHLPRHTFGSIQRQLFPYYFHISSTCAFLNLTLFALSHPSERLGEEHMSQLIIFLVCIAASMLNTQWFGQVTSDMVAELHGVERSHGLGQELGLAASEPRRQLCASNPSYRQLARQFALYHALSSLCNLCCIVCNGLSLYQLAAHLSAL